jgi:hypothetical protein
VATILARLFEVELGTSIATMLSILILFYPIFSSIYCRFIVGEGEIVVL